VRELASEVAELLRNTIRLNVRMNNVAAGEEEIEPKELATLGPRWAGTSGEGSGVLPVLLRRQRRAP
jgi:hypothetical protein